MSKHIYLSPVITMRITMYPSDDALIDPAPLVTALEASTQPSEPITQQQSKAGDTAVHSQHWIMFRSIHLLLTAQEHVKREKERKSYLN